MALAGVGLACAAEPDVGTRPDILLITLDTTRPDRLGFYGYERNTSPRLDALASESVVFTRAFSTSSWTLPAHASLFTGKFPTSHGALYDPEGPLLLSEAMPDADYLSHYRVRGLGPAQATLAGILAEAGYATGAVVAGPWMKRLFGLDRGFDFYDDRQIDALNGRLANQVTDSALGWIEEHGQHPFFLFLNYYDPHHPYADPENRMAEFLPPGKRAGRRDELTAAGRRAYYDAEIRFMDRHIGRLLDGLRERGLYDRTWIIVTADHGELLGEKKLWGHGATLTQAELWIPLLMKYPKDSGTTGRDETPIQLTDVFAGILAGLDLPLPADVQGRADPAGPGALYAEVYPLPAQRLPGWRVLMEGAYKLVMSTQGQRALFDLARDPAEVRDRSSLEPERTHAMTLRLEALVGGLPRPEPSGSTQAVDEETRRALQNLGYLE